MRVRFSRGGGHIEGPAAYTLQLHSAPMGPQSLHAGKGERGGEGLEEQRHGENHCHVTYRRIHGYVVSVFNVSSTLQLSRASTMALAQKTMSEICVVHDFALEQVPASVQCKYVV